jgi:O-antigen/teichoic acid export membrane protein
MFKNIGSNWLLMVVTVAATYILLPYSLKHIGQEQYGIWLIITSLTGYMGLLMLGVPMASVRFMADSLAKHDYEQMNKFIGSSAGLFLFAGVVSLVVGCGVFVFFESAFPIPPELRNPVRAAFFLVLFYIAGGFFGELPYGIMAAHHDFVLRNALQTITLVYRLLATVVLLKVYPSVASLAIVQLSSMALETTVLWTVIHRRYPEVRLDLRKFEMSTVRTIFSFSLLVLVLTVGFKLVFQTDSLVIGKFLDVSDVPFYAAANSLIIYLIEFVIGIASVVMPTATTLRALNQEHELRALLLKWSKIAISLSLLATLYLAEFGPRVLGVWIGPAFEVHSGHVLHVLLLSTVVFLPVRGIALPILMGVGKAKGAVWTLLATGVLNLGLSILWAKQYGLIGVAWGTTVPNLFYSVALLWLVCDEVRCHIWDYLRYVVVRAAIGGALTFAIVGTVDRYATLQGYLGLGAGGLLTVVTFGVIWLSFVYSKDPYFDLQGACARFIRMRWRSVDCS